MSRREKDLTRASAARRREDAVESLRALRPGDVVVIPGGRRAGGAVIVANPTAPGDEPRPTVVTVDRQVRRVSSVEISSPIEPIGRVRIPRHFNARNAQMRRDVANAARAIVESSGAPHRKRKPSVGDDAQIQQLREALRRHPCHGCADREHHARWAERSMRLRRERHDLEQRVEARTNSIARRFDHICGVLAELGYLTDVTDDAAVTAQGAMLMRLFGESDLLTAECIRRDLWNDLSAPDLAAVCSALVFESRMGELDSPKLPRGAVRPVLESMHEIRETLSEVERRHRLEPTRALDSGFVWATHRWASGASLQSVLDGTELTAGDFVRWTRQVIDLLGQLGQALDPGHPLRATAVAGADLLNRGVVSTASSL